MTKRSQSGSRALDRAWMSTLRAYRFTPGSERCMDIFSALRVGRYRSVRRLIGAWQNDPANANDDSAIGGAEPARDRGGQGGAAYIGGVVEVRPRLVKGCRECVPFNST